MIWEYMVVKLYGEYGNWDVDRVSQLLDKYGYERWELVAVTGNNTHSAFFKRLRT